MRRILAFIIIIVGCQRLSAQGVLVNDLLSDRSKFIDNTLLALWGGNGTPQTGFVIGNLTDNNSITYSGISLTASAQSNSGYTSGSSLKTLTSIDYQFPVNVDRNTDTVTVEFDGMWAATSSGGESGRLVVTLMGNYPSGGAQFGQVDDTSLTDPFGLPLYNIRIRNNPSPGNGPLMLYGAGVIPHPEWEIYSTGPWWLPGFSVQAGGGSPGSGPDYPLSGTKKSSLSIVSTTIWKHYTWKIMPERMELYHRNSNQTALSNTLVFFMQIPKYLDSSYVINEINTAHGTSITQVPPNYNWFRYTNGIRFYWRGGNNSFLSNVRVTRSSSILAVNKIQNFSAHIVNNQSILLEGLVTEGPGESELWVEHSRDGKIFSRLGKITSQNIDGNKLSFLHEQPAEGVNFYRILIERNKGDIEYTKVVTAEVNIPRISINVYPNPSSGKIFIQSKDIKDGTIQIYTSDGKLIMKKQVPENKIIEIYLKKGLYFYEVVDRALTIKNGKIVIK